MPQAQFLDIPNWGDALGKFGSGIMEGRQETKEADIISNIMNNLGEGASEEDLIAQLYGQQGRGLSSGARQTAASVIGGAKARSAKKIEDRAKQKKTEERDEERLKIARDRNDLQLKKLSKDEAKAYKKDVQPINSAINSVAEMRRIREKGNLGIPARGSQMIPFYGSEVRKDIGTYKTAAKSLIQEIMNVPIRNKHEFLEAAQELTDPYITDARAEGIISELERRFTQELDFLHKFYSGQEGYDRVDESPGESKSFADQVKAARNRRKK